jgi:hypothetical protein
MAPMASYASYERAELAPMRRENAVTIEAISSRAAVALWLSG